MCCGCTWGEREFLWGKDGGPSRGKRGGGSSWLPLMLLGAACVGLLTSGAPALRDDTQLAENNKKTKEVSFGNSQNLAENIVEDQTAQELAGGREGAEEQTEKELAGGREGAEEQIDAEAGRQNSRTFLSESDMEIADKADVEGDVNDGKLVLKPETEAHGDKPVKDIGKVKRKLSRSRRGSAVHHRVATKKRRDVPLMSETNMAPSSARRYKRDLSMDELQQILEDEEYGGAKYGGGAREAWRQNYDYSDYPDGSPYYDYDGEEEEGNDGGRGEETFLEDLPSKEEATEKELIRYEVLRELVAKRAEEQEKEEILDWLIAAADERLEEAVEEEKEAELEEDIMRDTELARRLDAARRVEQLTEKRKRYPYSYEPYGGRWGAMVPGSKRGGGMREEWPNYGRLYELARELDANEGGRYGERK